MGGYGSGRNNGYSCTDDYRSIDIRRWQRDGEIVPGNYLNWNWTVNGKSVASIGVKVETGQVRLIYKYQKNEDDWESLDYPVLLHTTHCHYGGERYWFICPALDCGRRAAILYLAGKYFACRHCYHLAYQCQREDSSDRLMRKADKIRVKLKWAPGIANPNGTKPKGMHWKTFDRLQAKQNSYALQSMEGTLAKLKSSDCLFP